MSLTHCLINHQLHDAHAAYREAKAAAYKLLQAEEARLQAACGNLGHRFKWLQVAGEGKRCEVCGLIDTSDD